MIREEKKEKLFFYLMFAGLIFGGLLVLQSCSQVQTTDPLDGTEWVLQMIGKSTLMTDTTITMKFADGQTTGNASCNSYFANYIVDGDAITFDTVGMTEMYCMDPEGIMDQETRFLQILPHARTFEVQDNQLQITLDDGDVLEFNAVQ